MEIALIIAVILIPFIYIFYIFNYLTKLNVKIKEYFIDISSSLNKRIDIILKIENIIDEDEKLREIVKQDTEVIEQGDQSRFFHLYKEIEKGRQKDKEDKIQNDLVEKYNQKISKLNNINILISEDEKMLDLGVNEYTLNKIKENIAIINQEKNLYKKTKNNFNDLINIYNKKISKLPSNFVANILGFTKYYNLK